MGLESATRRIQSLAARQHGHVTLDQLREAGLTTRQVGVRTRAGTLIPRHRRVYAVGYVPRSRASTFSAAVLALDSSALSHRAVGAHWNIVRGRVPTEVTVPTSAGRAHRDGIIVHRAPLPAEHITHRDGIRVTTLVRTLLDLAAVQGPRELARSFEEAQVQHGLQPDRLAVEVLSRRRYRGNGRLAGLLEDAIDPDRVRSILELRFLQLCATHGLPRPLVNERMGVWTTDFLWPAAGVVVETDGARFHRTAAKRRRDASKDVFLEAQGLRVIRLSWADVTERGAATAARLRAELGRDARSGGFQTR